MSNRLSQCSRASCGPSVVTAFALFLMSYLATPATAQTAPAASPPEQAKTEVTSEESSDSDNKIVASVATKAEKVTLGEVKDFMGKKVVLEYEVKSSTLIDAKKICFLNSMKNHRDDKNFAVIIKSDTIEKFAMAEIVDPAKHYFMKKIRVTGVVSEHRGKPQLLVKAVDQIKILDDEKKATSQSTEKQPAAK